VTGAGRYLRLHAAFARFALANEMAFRGNFLLKVFVEVLWLALLLIFYLVLFSYTDRVAGWTQAEYLFFLGCYYAMEGALETLFLENCSEFAELVRTGNLDFYLLRPIDEQFLITCRKIDWSTAPKVLLGGGIMVKALWDMNWPGDAGPAQAVGALLAFAALFVCGLALAYSFLLLLTATSVWLVRSASLFELWWLVTTVMRYPKEIYRGRWGGPLGWVFWYLLPLLLVINVPARVVVNLAFDPWSLLLLVAAAVVSLYLSRRFFFRALRAYRSASS
jgi:ABC-2 type transport system permease protein